MGYIPLIEHTRPRIVMLDFSPADVQKICKAGFDAKRAASGGIKNDNNQYFFPCTVHDADIIFAYIHPDSFGNQPDVNPDSVETTLVFNRLTQETVGKSGWIVCFIEPNTDPDVLHHLGITKIGVTKTTNGYRHADEAPHYEEKIFPNHTANGINIDENWGATSIFKRFLSSAQFSIFSCPNHSYLKQDEVLNASKMNVNYDIHQAKFLIWDTSLKPNALALQFNNVHEVKNSQILILPNFGKNNVNFALALLQEIIPRSSPNLFDSPSHPWLEKYQVASVLKIQSEKEKVIRVARETLDNLNKEEEVEKEKYSWLLGLLVSMGDEFADNATVALRFLDFDVQDIDKELIHGARKREDFHIYHRPSNFFALGEAKTTGKNRGAQEDFISKTQTHQQKYSRDNKVPVPPALMIANFAIDLDPAQRTGLFYQPEVSERLEDAGITAISSVALYQLCQLVFENKITKDAAREYLSSGRPMINTVSIEDVT